MLYILMQIMATAILGVILVTTLGLLMRCFIHLIWLPFLGMVRLTKHVIAAPLPVRQIPRDRPFSRQPRHAEEILVFVQEPQTKD